MNTASTSYSRKFDDLTIIVKGEKRSLVKRRPIVVDDEITWSSVAGSSTITGVQVTTSDGQTYQWDAAVTPNGNDITIQFSDKGLITMDTVSEACLITEDGRKIEF